MGYGESIIRLLAGTGRSAVTSPSHRQVISRSWGTGMLIYNNNNNDYNDDDDVNEEVLVLIVKLVPSN